MFAGRIFFRSAWGALSHGRMNMDVPIALGVSLAYAMSLYETINHGDHAYFDAAVSLLFFLLIGRTLDHVMRDRARTAVHGLASLAPRGALVLRTDGSREYRPVGEIEPGMQLLIAAGDRIPVDARVIAGVSDLDCSLVTGESEPQPAEPGIMLRAGTMNLTGALTIEATAAAKDSFLAEMLRLMEAAEGGRTRYRRIADRASALYSPVVHLTALLTFIGWMAVSGDWHRAVTIAVAVLIITCPCALGLAVPIVQVVAARLLFENGIMVKDGSAMERLAEIDTAVFDKTGTLTMGRPRLMNADAIGRDALALAAAIASHSRHPFSRAIFEAGPRNAGPIGRFERVTEFPGLGVEAWDGTDLYRLGRAQWALDAAAAGGLAGTTLARNGRAIAAFALRGYRRADAGGALSALRLAGLRVEMLSGDRRRMRGRWPPRFRSTLRRRNAAGCQGRAPAALAAGGARTLMVGDGLNDAPALSAAHVSMAPATAADVGRNAADFVFLRDSLKAVPLALDVSRNADRLIRQNFALAVGYNAIAVPIAILGYVTPLIAAIAMSMSSLLVIGNALRLRAGRPSRRVASVTRLSGGGAGHVAINHPAVVR